MPTRLLDSTTHLFRDGERLVDHVIESFSLRVAGDVRRRHPHIKQVSRALNATSWRGPDRCSPQPSLDLAARAQLGEQLRPAFSNLIVGYWSMEG
jgi:nucleotidyltransferase/DNA polymerase involved in DNA repair